MLRATCVLRPEGAEPSLPPATPRGGLWHGACGAELLLSSSLKALAPGGAPAHPSSAVIPVPLNGPVWLSLGEQVRLRDEPIAEWPWGTWHLGDPSRGDLNESAVPSH